MPVTAAAMEEKIADNVQKKFSKNFPGITGEVWATLRNGYEVVFKNGKVQNRVFLTRKGNIKYQISYYTEAELPADVRKRVKSEFFDYNIFCVQEINYNQAKIYLVTLEDKTTWKVLRLDDNEMEVYKEFVKG
ncbi:hypothetical protein [Niastella yeongjuensis]|nr:hypothetical protein [Niastella yeongjuensis]